MSKQNRVRFWDYHCDMCGQTGSCPIPFDTSMLNAVVMVGEAHGQFNPKCHNQYQGRWIQIIGMACYD